MDPLFPVEEISMWLDENDIAPRRPLSVERLAGGRSNVMFRVARGDRRMVLRRPAQVAVERADEGIRREFRVLGALDGSDVPHPAALALCDDSDRIGCAFYVMEEVQGHLPISLPDTLGRPSDVRRQVTLAATDALAALHRLDWQSRGLTDFGQPDGFHQRQVTRWTTQYDGYQGRPIPEVEAVGQWLDRHLPSEWWPTIMHADYHMMNMLIAPDQPVRVAAILDWETATIGDPLLDLAGYCEVWCGALHGDGWPERSEIVERYAQQRGIDDLPDLRYYEVLYNFRLGILLEGVYQRSLVDPSRTDDDLAGDRALHNLRRAAELAV